MKYAKRGVYGLIIEGREASCWVIESSPQYAFLITCWHTSMSKAKNISVVTPKTRYDDARIVACHTKFSLAVVIITSLTDTNDIARPGLTISQSELPRSETVYILGFDPSSKKIRLSNGMTLGAVRGDAKWRRATDITIPIESCGGPIVDHEGDVIGIAAPGGDGGDVTVPVTVPADCIDVVAAVEFYSTVRRHFDANGIPLVTTKPSTVSKPAAVNNKAPPGPQDAGASEVMVVS